MMSILLAPVLLLTTVTSLWNVFAASTSSKARAVVPETIYLRPAAPSSGIISPSVTKTVTGSLYFSVGSTAANLSLTDPGAPSISLSGVSACGHSAPCACRMGQLRDGRIPVRRHRRRRCQSQRYSLSRALSCRMERLQHPGLTVHPFSPGIFPLRRPQYSRRSFICQN